MAQISRGWYWTALIVGALFLIQYWAEFFVLVRNGDPWGHKNYWGADVGTYLILAVLVVATPAYLWMAWKHRPKNLR